MGPVLGCHQSFYGLGIIVGLSLGIFLNILISVLPCFNSYEGRPILIYYDAPLCLISLWELLNYFNPVTLGQLAQEQFYLQAIPLDQPNYWYYLAHMKSDLSL